MYRREVDGKVYDFDHCGYVYKGSFVMFDRQTGSEWIHVTTECVMGPLKGTQVVEERHLGCGVGRLRVGAARVAPESREPPLARRAVLPFPWGCAW